MHSSSVISSVYHLTKFGISFSVALTTATGYFLSTGKVDLTVVNPFLGVLFLAMSASTINQVEEKETDKLMPRTQKRPLANGSVSVKVAVLLAGILAILGFLVLFSDGVFVALLGLFNLVWYNLVYTPLKYRTAFASIPGGIVGAIPPVIGWVAGGGHIMHLSALSLALFFFIGQIPHFWLILFKYAHEYQLAGIKLVTDKFSREQLKRVIFSWIMATSLSGSLLAFYIIINHNVVFYLIHILSVSLVIYFVKWLGNKPDHESSRAFITINAYYLAIMLLIVIDYAFG
ncbi:MAG TPA: protoheme IX farnesyltransferase [Lentimicrobium sp.]|nr:protoheme IX farnesyltransferase [Lentimicrobium sp.]